MKFTNKRLMYKIMIRRMSLVDVCRTQSESSTHSSQTAIVALTMSLPSKQHRESGDLLLTFCLLNCLN